MASRSAIDTSTGTPRNGRLAVIARVALGALLVVTAMAVPQLSAPPGVEASSCTGWNSQVVPPRTIRVLRSGSGRVERVDFRRYVAEVMASGEWPGRLRKATLAAGAVATKQYAWYYTLKGNHRPGYVRNGKCYDVRDDTSDQLYRPERATPTSKQKAAIDRTWGLTLRKNGRFFLTGYRMGASQRCAADANGWKLYERSVEACARKGWSYQRILKTYLSPHLHLVWSNKLGPLLKKPSFNLQTGTNYDKGAATVAWKPTSSSVEVASYRLQRKVGKNAWKDVDLRSKTARQTRSWVKIGSSNKFRVRGKDAKGHAGPWAYSAKRKPGIRGPVGAKISGADFDPSSVRSKIRVKFDGRSVAFMTRTGPGMGKVRILLNGKRVATKDLDRDTVTDGALVWTRNFPRSKPRTIAVRAIDAAQRVDFDGFFVLR